MEVLPLTYRVFIIGDCLCHTVMTDSYLEKQNWVHQALRDFRDSLARYQSGGLSKEDFDSRFQHVLHLQSQRENAFVEQLAHEPKLTWYNDNSSLVGKLTLLRSDLAELKSFGSFDGLDKPFQEERRFCLYAISRIEAELRDRGVPVERNHDVDPIENATTAIRRRIETEARLNRQCEEDVKKYPDQEDAIRRSYRKAIDALRDSD